MFFFKPARPAAPRPQASRLRQPQARPTLEILETRVVPYATSGNAWPAPQLVTISFLPDGTLMCQGCGGAVTSNLFASFNLIPGVTNSSQWENLIIKAAQQWAQQTNLNFTVIADDGEAIGSGAYQQGNPNFGDVRIGGNVFGYNWLGSTYYPPPVNNYSLAGDIAFNTGYAFNIGSTYDLFTVTMHEFGHALGLGNSNSSSAVMYGTYNGAFSGLSSDDIAGIQAIYSNGSPRAHDVYNSNGHSNGSFSSAANITSSIDSSLTAVVTGLDITTIGQVEYFKFTAPSNSASTMSISVQSAGLSLLTPKVTVYNASYTAIGSASFRLGSGAVEDGATLTLSNLAVTPGATYYIAVGGVDRTAFSTGAYALTLNLGTGPNPTVPLPNTQLANGSPLQSGGGQPQVADSASPPVSAHPADASLAHGLLGHGGAATVAAATTAGNSPASALSSQTPPITVLTRATAAALLANRTDEAGTRVADPVGSPAAAEEGNPAASPAAEHNGTDQSVDAQVFDETWRTLASEAPRPEAMSAPAVAEAALSDWTQDGALAAATVLLGGAGVRWHAAHSSEEPRRHHPKQQKDASR
jgi:hypothetical protein